MLEDYRSGKSFGRPRLGVSVVYINGEFAEALELPATGGLLIQNIARGSAAESAGLKGPRQMVIVGNAAPMASRRSWMRCARNSRPRFRIQSRAAASLRPRIR